MGHFPVYNDAKEKQKKLKIMTKLGKKIFKVICHLIKVYSNRIYCRDGQNSDFLIQVKSGQVITN
jgi:hypothetical protein